MSTEILIQAALAVIGTLGLLIFNAAFNAFKDATKDIKSLVGGVSELNIKIAVIIERIESHERRLDKLEGEK